jgi:hypothetical protein
LELPSRRLNHSKLLHQSPLIPISHSFTDFAISNSDHKRCRPDHTLACGRYTKILTSMCTTRLIATDNYVPLGDLVQYIEMNVRQSIPETRDERFQPIKTDIWVWSIVIIVIGRDNLIGHAWITKFEHL